MTFFDIGDPNRAMTANYFIAPQALHDIFMTQVDSCLQTAIANGNPYLSGTPSPITSLRLFCVITIKNTFEQTELGLLSLCGNLSQASESVMDTE